MRRVHASARGVRPGPRAAETRRRRRGSSCKIDVRRVNCVILLALGTKSQGVLALHGK